MRHTKLIFLALSVICIFSGIAIFTACTKSTCSGITCLNGGTCSNGTCTCPAGYSGALCGSKAKSSISYKNNTFTPVSIGVNGISATIPVGGSVTFTDTAGAVATGSATTSGAASQYGISTSGGILGLTINWQLNNVFPASDTLRVPLDVGATYFFLRLQNNYSKNIIDYYVNYGFPYGMSYMDATIPNDGKTYDMGYYLAYSNSNVQIQASDNKVIWKAVTLPFTNNQIFTVSFP